MNFLLDFIIILIIITTILSAVKNGLIKTAISAVSFLVAVVVTLMFTTPLADTLKETPISDTIREATEAKVSDIIVEGGYNSINALLSENEEFKALITVAGLDESDIIESVSGSLTNGVDPITSLASSIAECIAEPIINIISTIVAIIILFVGTQLVLAIVAKILDIVAKLPILNGFNKTGGLILGVVLAFIRVCLFCFIINIIIENKDFLGSAFIENLEPDKTLLFNYFRNIDIFKFFIS